MKQYLLFIFTFQYIFKNFQSKLKRSFLSKKVTKNLQKFKKTSKNSKFYFNFIFFFKLIFFKSLYVSYEKE